MRVPPEAPRALPPSLVGTGGASGTLRSWRQSTQGRWRSTRAMRRGTASALLAGCLGIRCPRSGSSPSMFQTANLMPFPWMATAKKSTAGIKLVGQCLDSTCRKARFTMSSPKTRDHHPSSPATRCFGSQGGRHIALVRESIEDKADRKVSVVRVSYDKQ